MGRLPRRAIWALLTLLILPVNVTWGASESCPWGRDRLQEIAAKVLSEFLGATVYIGKFSGNFLTGITLHDVTIADPKARPPQAVFQVDRVVLKYDMIAVLKRQQEPLESLDSIVLYQPRLWVDRNRQGQLNLMRFLPKPRKPAPESKFQTPIRIVDGALYYTDHSPFYRSGKMAVRLEKLTGLIEFPQSGRMEAGLSASVASHQAHRLSVRLINDTQRQAFCLQANISQLDLSWANGLVAQPGMPRVRSGRADVKGNLTIFSASQPTRITLNARTSLDRMRVHVPQLGGDEVHLQGPLAVSLDGLQTSGLHIEHRGARYLLQGAVIDFTHPTLDLAVTTPSAPLGILAGYFPVLREAFGLTLDPATRGRVDLKAIGPVEWANVEAQLEIPGSLVGRSNELGGVSLQGVNLNARIIGLSDPLVTTQATVTRLSAPKAIAHFAPSILESLKLDTLQNIEAELSTSGPHYRLQLQAMVPNVYWAGLNISQAKLKAVFADGKANIQNLTAQGMGGILNARGTISLAPEPQLRLQGEIQHLDLATLTGLSDKLPSNLAGTADASFDAAFSGDQGSVIAELQAKNIHAGELAAHSMFLHFGANHQKDWQGVGLIKVQQAEMRGVTADRAAGQLLLEGETLKLPSGFVESPQGTVWVQGQADLGAQTIEGKYQAANIDLAQLAPFIEAEDIKGKAFLSGSVAGPWADPEAQAHVVIFRPGHADYSLDALTAALSYQAHKLVAQQILASKDSTIVAANGTFGPLLADLKLEETPLSGAFELEGATLEQLAEYFPDFPEVTGMIEASGFVTGTPAQPLVRGVARVFHGQYQDFITDYAEVPFNATSELLTVQSARLRGQGATLSATGSLGLKEPHPVDLRVAATGLRLETMPFVVEHQLPIQGEVNLPSAWLRGPLKGLQGNGKLEGKALNWAGEPIDRFTTELSVADGLLTLDQTHMQLAGGELTASGSYGYEEIHRGQVQGNLKVSRMNIKGLLEIATPLAFLWAGQDAKREDDLQRQLSSLNLRLDGQIEGQVSLAGTVETPRTTVKMVADNLKLDGRALPDIDGSTTIEGQSVPEIAFAFKQGEALITADGSYTAPDDLDLSIGGSGISLTQLQPWISSELPYGGRLGLSVVATGNPRAPDLMGSIDIESPSLAGVRFDVLTVPLITVNEGAINVDSLIVKRGKQEILVDGRLPFSWAQAPPGGGPERPGLALNEPLSITGKIEQTDLAFFPPLIDEFLRNRVETVGGATASQHLYANLEALGTVDSQLEVKGTLNHPLLEGFLRIADANLKPQSFTTPFSKVNVDLSMWSNNQDTIVKVNTCTGQWDQIKAALTGTASLLSLKPEELARNQFDMNLALSADGQRVPGGTVINSLSGGFTLRTETSGEQLLVADELTALIGGGKLTWNGLARLKSFQSTDLAKQFYNMTISADDVRIRYEPLLDAILDGQMKISSRVSPQRALISGSWLLDRGLLGIPTSGKQGGTLLALGSHLPDPEFDIHVALGRGLRLRGSGINAAVTAAQDAIILKGTPQLPQLTGVLSLAEGTTTLPRATMQITQFEVNYALKPADTHSDPAELLLTGDVRGQAEAILRADQGSRDDSVRIIMDISGALPDQIRVNATSEPPLTETQIFALLGGIPFATVTQGVVRDSDLAEVLSEQFLSTLAAAFRLRVFEPFEDELKRALGLDQLTVHFTYDQPVSVKLGKYLLQDLLITYERSMAEGPDIYDLNVSYILPRGIRVSYHTDERGDHRVEVGYSRPF
jgi:hypothetical protein